MMNRIEDAARIVAEAVSIALIASVLGVAFAVAIVISEVGLIRW